MFWRVSSAALIAMSTIGSEASAQFKEPQPGYFHCEAPAGNYYNQEIPGLQPKSTVTVRIKPISENFDQTWAMQGSIYFEAPTGRRRVSVGTADNDRQHIYVALQRDDNGDSEVLDEYPVTSDWIDLALTLGKDGVLRVESRGHKGKLDLGTPSPVTTKLHCHSGMFDFQVVRPQG